MSRPQDALTLIDQIIGQLADRNAQGLPSGVLRLSPQDHARLRHEVWRTPGADTQRLLGTHSVEPVDKEQRFYGLRIVIEGGPVRVEADPLLQPSEVPDGQA